MIQSDIFKAFCDLITGNTEISNMVDAQIIPAPQTPPLSYFVNNADASVNKTAVLLNIVREDTKLQDQGFGSQYRVRVDFEYEVLVLSKKGDNKDYCESVLDKIRALCHDSSGDLVFKNTDSALAYRIEETPEAQFWQGTLKVSGIAFIKVI